MTGDAFLTALSNLAQLAAATWAAWCCLQAARASRAGRRTAWRWIALGVGAWASGQAVWTFYEVLLGRLVPFPSAADAGFLTFPLLAGVGLGYWLVAQGPLPSGVLRSFLDAMLIAGSLLALSWVTVLGSVPLGGDAPLSVALSLAYPLADVVLATLVLVAVSRGGSRDRAVLTALALGLGSLAVSDSAYAYLVAQQEFASADVASAGWFLGFVLVGTAARLSVRANDRRPFGDEVGGPDPTAGGAASLSRLVVPTLPFLLAIAAIVVRLSQTARENRVELAVGFLLVVAMLARQFFALADNRRLLITLGRVREELEHQSLHDPLTGLANRALLGDRLDRALAQPSGDVSILFCDLDNLKVVNDRWGHEGGDRVLQHVAHQLIGCVRGTDTVARLGGDEFVILLEGSTHVQQVARRVGECLREPFELQGDLVLLTMSVGVAHHAAPPPPPGDRRGRGIGELARESTPQPSSGERRQMAEVLLRRADEAMYAAKGAGKGRVEFAPPDSGDPVGAPSR